MKPIKIVDTLFAHAKYSTDVQESKYITWDRSPINPNDDIVFYTDTSIVRVNPMVKHNYAWLLESTAVTGQFYQMIKYNHLLFENVFTYDKELLDLGKNFKFSPTGGCWIKPEDQKLWDKSKYVSCIMSSKNWSDGHKLRHNILNYAKSHNMCNIGASTDTYPASDRIDNWGFKTGTDISDASTWNGKIDFYGDAVGMRVGSKIDALKDYMFSIVIENNEKDYYFTEKLIDCFRCGVVPIYWGCPSIGKFFDERGMMHFHDVEECFGGLNDVLQVWYKKNFKFIEENYRLAERYLMSEDYIWAEYFSDRK